MPTYYTCDEVAERYKVKKLTVYDWIRKGKLKAFKPGKNYLISEQQLNEFETQNTQ